MLVGISFTLAGCQSPQTKLSSKLQKISEAHKKFVKKNQKIVTKNKKVPKKPVSIYCLSPEEYELTNQNSNNNILGNGDEKLDTDAKPFKQVPPTYPIKAVNNNIEGFAKASTIINEQGCYTNIKIIESQPQGVFDDAMIDALKKWRHTPALIAGRPVKVKTFIQIDFKFSKPHQKKTRPKSKVDLNFEKLVNESELEKLVNDKLNAVKP